MTRGARLMEAPFARPLNRAFEGTEIIPGMPVLLNHPSFVKILMIIHIDPTLLTRSDRVNKRC